MINLLIVMCFMTLQSFGQKIKYKDYKNEVSTDNYSEIVKNPKYSPLVAGVCNYVIPSSGYFYVGEPLRGVTVLGSELITSSVFISGIIMSMSVDNETGKSPNGARALMFSGMITTGIIQIWSIFDVVKIAKIKNIAYQENKLTIRMKPNLFYINQHTNNSMFCGLQISINF